MEAIILSLAWISDNWPLLLAFHGAASVICAMTPTPADDELLGQLYKVLELLALNVGKAKDKG